MAEEATKQEIKIAEPELSSLTLMKQLADNDLSNVVDMDADRLIDRTKLFLIANARNNLNRIIKMTVFLEKLENKFIDLMNEKIDDDAVNLEMVSLAMATISKSIEDANNQVMQILKDDKLQKIVINTTNIITPDGGSATIIDADSRDEVRNLAASLLAQLTNFSQESGIVEAEATEQ